MVDIQPSGKQAIAGFLRLQRQAGNDPQRLEREVRIMQALGEQGIPVPEVYAWSPEHRAALLERDPGSAAIDQLTDPDQQRDIMQDFMHWVARFHLLDPAQLSLDDIMLYQPVTPRDCALREVDELQSQWRFFLRDYRDPLLIYGLHWLERFAPAEVARVSLLQGDTGPVNFMFQGNRVSSIVDWECGHYGDPLEDLGNIMVREFWNPCGGLKGLFTQYEEQSGIPYDRFRTQYYAVQQNVRGMIPIHYVAINGIEQESLAWYLCYRYLGDRATAEMLASAMQIEVEQPEYPDTEHSAEASSDILADSAYTMLQHDVLAQLENEFAQSRGRDVLALIACMDRRRRYGTAVEADELADLGAALGQTPASLADGHSALAKHIAAGTLEDQVIVRLLLRKAYRDEWLYKPAVALYPDRQWSEID